MKIIYNPDNECFVIQFDESLTSEMKGRKEPFQLRFQSGFLSKDELQKRVEFIIRKVSSHPAAMELLKSVLAKRSLKITFDAHETMPAAALYDQTEGIITIAIEVPESALIGHFIFELCNANNIFLHEVSWFICDPFLDEMGYGMLMETGEYETYVQFALLCNQALENGIANWIEENQKKRQIEPLDEYLKSNKANFLSHAGFSHTGVYEFYFLKEQEKQLKKAKANIDQELKYFEELEALYSVIDKEPLAQLQINLLKLKITNHLLTQKREIFNKIQILSAVSNPRLKAKAARTLEFLQDSCLAIDKEIALIDGNLVKDDIAVKIKNLRIQRQNYEKQLSEIQARIKFMEESARLAVERLKIDQTLKERWIEKILRQIDECKEEIDKLLKIVFPTEMQGASLNKIKSDFQQKIQELLVDFNILHTKIKDPTELQFIGIDVLEHHMNKFVALKENCQIVLKELMVLAEDWAVLLKNPLQKPRGILHKFCCFKSEQNQKQKVSSNGVKSQPF